MKQARVCSAIISSLMIATGMVLVTHVVILTLTVLEEFDEIPTVQMVPMPVLICAAALLALIGGNLGFAGTVFTCCVKVVPLLWAVCTIVFALLLEGLTVAALWTLVEQEEMDEDLQDIYFNVQLSTGLVIGTVISVQLTVLDYYFYLLKFDKLCFRSRLCWPACFMEEICSDDDSVVLDCECSEDQTTASH